MRAIFAGGAAALVLLALPAAAQNDTSKTIDPVELGKTVKGPPAQISDEQKMAIRNGLVAVHTQQKAPKDFKPQVGQALPKPLKVDTLPQDLVRKHPALKEYGYAKTTSDILVLDPMKKTIVAVIPRKFPNDGTAAAVTPSQWWDNHAREMTGRAPLSGGSAGEPPEAGDAAAVANGGAENGQPQDSGLQPGYQSKH
jgi:hypothetical protein